MRTPVRHQMRPWAGEPGSRVKGAKLVPAAGPFYGYFSRPDSIHNQGFGKRPESDARLRDDVMQRYHNGHSEGGFEAAVRL